MGHEARTWLTILGSLVAGVVYGIVARVVFETSPAMEVMSVGFLFVLPFVIGFVTGAVAPPRLGVGYRLFFPWVTVTLYALGTALLALEGMICIVMMLPVAAIMGSAGGAASLAFFPAGKKDRFGGPPRKPLGALLLPLVVGPFLFGLGEERLDLPEDTREVWTRIDIAADPAAVWREIEQVPEIGEAERRPGFFHDIGFPYPVEATIDGEGVGAVRHASFERGILFEEVVTVWEPERLLSFSIDVDAESIPTTTMDRHVVVGGRYFDTLDGTYRIEPKDDGTVTLHLGSRHRLSTRFNVYARLWTDAIMASIQDEILLIVRDRAEGRVRR